jgi:hypothetical protein
MRKSNGPPQATRFIERRWNGRLLLGQGLPHIFIWGSLKGLWRVAVAMKVERPAPLALEVESLMHFANQLLLRV